MSFSFRHNSSNTVEDLEVPLKMKGKVRQRGGKVKVHWIEQRRKKTGIYDRWLLCRINTSQVSRARAFFFLNLYSTNLTNFAHWLCGNLWPLPPSPNLCYLDHESFIVFDSDRRIVCYCLSSSMFSLSCVTLNNHHKLHHP